MPFGRAVGDQDIRLRWDEFPFFSHFPSPVQIERPIVKPRLPRRAIDIKAFYIGAAVLQIDNIFIQKLSRECGLELEKPVVISGYEYFVFMRQRAKPRVEFRDLVDRTRSVASPAWMSRSPSGTAISRL